MSQIEWKPHRKQAEFLALPTTIKEALYGGGAGSAKTETLLWYGIIRGWHNNPRFKQVFMRRTFPELRNEVVPRARQIYRPFGGELNLSNMAFTFPSGAMIFLGHCENEDDVHKYDSMEISLFTPDELTSFTEWIYTYIGFQRVRAPINSGLPAIIRAGGMPGNIGHSWVKKRFVDPAPKGGKIIVGRGGIKRIYIHATLADNPYVDPTYKDSLEALPEAEKQAKKYGSWDSYLGQVFEEFRDKQYADEPENALHVIEPFEIPNWWPKIVVIDWGYRAMTWVGYGAISPSKRLYIYREQAWRETKINEWAPLVREYIEKEDPKIIRMCKSAGQDRGQEHTIQQQVSEALDITIDLTSNTPGSRVAGKNLLHEYLRWKQKPVIERELLPYNEEHAMWLLRNKGMVEYKNYLNSFNPIIDEDNLPKLQIFNNCKELINSIKACTYDKHNPEDVMGFDGDDPYDGIRYMIDIADKYFDESESELKRVQAQSNISRNFEETRDWNALYRQARILESKDRIKPIKRYHRGTR